MIEIDENRFFRVAVLMIHMDERTSFWSITDETKEGRAVDEQIFARMMGWTE